jgi:hypothetical protein
MRLAILTASILVLGVLVLVGLVHLVQELLIKEFFQPPSMPGENSTPHHQATRETSSHSANPTA